jgi:hypothetical protein
MNIFGVTRQFGFYIFRHQVAYYFAISYGWGLGGQPDPSIKPSKCCGKGWMDATLGLVVYPALWRL